MGNVAHHTDLSWEIPGPRAHVYLSLGSYRLCLQLPGAGLRPERERSDPVSARADEPIAAVGLEEP
jgi:hypothetical protein